MDISETLNKARNKLAACDGFDENLADGGVVLDVDLLLAHSLGKARSYLYAYPERIFNEAERNQFNDLLERRCQGEPVAYLLGQREFWSLNLTVNASVLIPRPETESLVEWALQQSLPSEAKVLDLGTGSGAIALALASERPDWKIDAVDFSAFALETAKINGAALQLPNVQFIQSDWFASLIGRRYDLLISNPPYIATGDQHLKQGDVRFEPQLALSSGVDGLDSLAHIINNAAAFLNEGSMIALEHGYDQGLAVQRLLQTAGFKASQLLQDYAGIDRISVACSNSKNKPKHKR